MPLRRRAKRRIALVLAAALLPVLPALTSAARADDPPGTLVLPPRTSQVPATIGFMTASAFGLAYYRLDLSPGAPMRFRSLTENTHHTAAAPFKQYAWNGKAVGTYLTGLVTDPNAAQRNRVAFIDLTTQAVTYSSMTYNSTCCFSNQDKYLGPTGDGWIGLASTQGFHEVELYGRTGGVTALMALPRDDETTHVYNDVTAVTADDAGALLTVTTDDTDTGTTLAALYYVDYATKTPVKVVDFGQPFSRTALSPTSLAYTDFVSGTGWSIHRRLRSSPGTDAATRVLGTTSVGGLAITDSTTAWIQATSSGPDYHKIRAATAPAAEGSAATLVTDEVLQDSSAISVIDNGDFAVIAGDSAATRGVYRFAAGSTSLGAALDLAGAGPPLSLDAASGRLAYGVLADTSGNLQLNDQGVDSSAGALSLRGEPRDLGVDLGTADLTSARTADLERSGGSTYAVVRDGTVVTARIPVASETYGIAVSGYRLVTAQLGPHVPNADPTNGKGLLYDLRNPGAAPVTVPESSALSGHHLAYLKTSGESSDGTVAVLDLDHLSTAPVVVRPAGVPAGVESNPEPRRSQVLMAGDWVGWYLGSSTGGVTEFPGPAGEVSFARMSDPTTTYDLTGQTTNDLRLADGVAAFIDGDLQVHLVDLVAHTDTVVGAAHSIISNHTYLALTNDFLAWVAPDDTTHVLPISTQVDPAPAALGGFTPRSFSPALRRWDFSEDATRPLSAYTLVVKNSHGATVVTRSAAAADGGVRQAWDGRTSSGQPAPDGTYTWTLTGSGTGGDLLSGGTSSPLTGTVVLDRVAPASVVTKAPIRSSDVSTQPPFLVSWSGSEQGLLYDVDVEYRVRTPHSYTWSPPKRWLTGTRGLSGIYRGAPFAVSQGQTLRFLVTGRDAAGNKRAAGGANTVVPLDDRSTSFAYGAGWTSSSSPADYLHTARSAAAVGRTVTLSALATSVDLLGDRCATCGDAKLYVDGKYLRTISSRASTTQHHAVLATVAFSGLGPHSVRLVLVGSRPLTLDGAALHR